MISPWKALTRTPEPHAASHNAGGSDLVEGGGGGGGPYVLLADAAPLSSNIPAALSPAGAAGATGTASDGGHSHPTTGLLGLAETVNTVAASGAALAIPDPSAATINYVTLTANCTLTFPIAVAGLSFTLALKQDATGTRTVTWPAAVKWSSGSAPGLSAVAGKLDVVSFLCLDGTNWAGFTAGLDIR